ncbi:type III-A CRISPR-associated RAMP protein Csm3, partial [Ligilactobacillus salivarius]
EIKFENTIDRFTAVAKPRQIERVIRGSKFNFEIIYDVGNEKEVEEDIQLVKTGFKLLENDYLGGSGSRGYGKVKFENLSIKPVLGDYDVKELNAILEG